MQMPAMEITTADARKRSPHWLILSILMLASAALTGPARACSTFCLQGEKEVLLAKNYDWSVGEGFLMVNPRGVAKAADASGSARGARWTSRFGSVTFNQFGEEFPNGGINEAGLVVEILWLDETRYPSPDSRPEVDCLQWIQYQLDTAATVDEVLASDKHIRIAADAPVHYMVADAEGRVATFELLGGRLVAHTGDSLPHPVLTNSTYSGSLRYLKRLGEQRPNFTDRSSLGRFAEASERVLDFHQNPPEDALAHAFTTLDRVAQGSYTQWRIVYELRARRVHFHTGDGRIKTLALQELDFSCSSPTLAVDLHLADPIPERGGDLLPHLRPYSQAQNEILVRDSFRRISFLASTPEEELRRIVHYPETTLCSTPSSPP